MQTPKVRLTSLIPEFVKRPVRRLLAPYRLRRSWMVRSSMKGDDHLAIYWNAEAQPNRQRLIQILLEEYALLHAAGGLSGVLEYGSHVGLNLRMLHDMLPPETLTSFCAVEPNAEAVAFLQEKLPFVKVLQGEDEVFCRQPDFPPAGAYLTFVNSVFYAMEPRRVRATLARISAFSDSVVLGESISNLEGVASKMRNQPECFEHPYRHWFDELGFEIVQHEAAPDPRPQLNGFVVARRRPS